MENLFFVLYVILVAQVVFADKPIKIKSGNTVARSRNSYMISGLVNFLLGACGMLFINLFLRDKEIISQMYMWIGLVGFTLVYAYGAYCLVKMVLTLE